MSDLEERNGCPEPALPAQLIETLDQRGREGQKTTLRDLHTLLDASQSSALRIAHQLEREGVLVITHDIHDALGSTIAMAPAAETRMERLKQLLRPTPR
ncbi:MAG: hypothetical protein AAF291_04265 [Pseudomonadota bacterium]